MSKLKLLSGQKEHFQRCLSIITKYDCYMDNSECGQGKTYVALALAHHLGLPLFVCCPVSIITKWKKCIEEYNLPSIDVVSYSAIRGNKDNRNYSPWITRHNQDKSYYFEATDKFKQAVEEGLIIIFDECQNLKNENSAQSKASICLSQTIKFIPNNPSKIGLLSMTPFCDEHNIANILSAMGLITKPLYKYIPIEKRYQQDGYIELLTLAKSIVENNQIKSKELKQILSYPAVNNKHINHLSYLIYSNILKSQLTSAMIKDNSSKTQIISTITNCYCKIINEENYSRANHILNNIYKLLRTHSCPLGDIVTSLREIELIKSEIFIRKAAKILDEDSNKKVLIFLNFLNSMDYVSKYLTKYNPLILSGSHSKNLSHRHEIITKFQSPTKEYRLLIAHPQVGGVGLDLDDIYGNRPRVCFISPSYKFIDIYQATGRINRKYTLSDSKTYFIYTNIPLERKVQLSLIKKSKTLRSAIQGEYSKSFDGFESEYDSIDIEELNQE